MMAPFPWNRRTPTATAATTADNDSPTNIFSVVARQVSAEATEHPLSRPAPLAPICIHCGRQSDTSSPPTGSTTTSSGERRYECPSCHATAAIDLVDRAYHDQLRQLLRELESSIDGFERMEIQRDMRMLHRWMLDQKDIWNGFRRFSFRQENE